MQRDATMSDNEPAARLTLWLSVCRIGEVLKADTQRLTITDFRAITFLSWALLTCSPLGAFPSLWEWKYDFGAFR